jgi:hypothetical protein
VKDRKQLMTGARRRITDEQIAILRSWVPFKTLARALGISQKYATNIRRGRVYHKNPSP